MRNLLLIVLSLVTLPAVAAHPVAYSPAWGGRDLAVHARALDDSATRLYQDLRSHSYRSDVTSRARDLARATQDFRHLADRRASYSQLATSFRRVEQREEALARRLHDSRGYDGYGQPVASLRRVHSAMQRVDHALQRYAFDGRDNRYRGNFVYVPRYNYRYDFGYGTRYGYRYDARHPQRDDRRHDQRGDQRDNRRPDQRDDRRDDRQPDRRDDQRQDQRRDHRDDGRNDLQQDRQDDRREERRDDRRPDPPAKRADDEDDRRWSRDPDVRVQEP